LLYHFSNNLHILNYQSIFVFLYHIFDLLSLTIHQKKLLYFHILLFALMLLIFHLLMELSKALAVKQKALELLTGENCLDDMAGAISFIDLVSYIDTELAEILKSKCASGRESDEEIKKKVCAVFPDAMRYPDWLRHAIEQSNGNPSIAKVFVGAMICLRMIGLYELKDVMPRRDCKLSLEGVEVDPDGRNQVKVKVPFHRDPKVPTHPKDCLQVCLHGEKKWREFLIGEVRDTSQEVFLGREFAPGFYFFRVISGSNNRELTRSEYFFLPGVDETGNLTDEPDVFCDFSFNGTKRSLIITSFNRVISEEAKVGIFVSWTLKNDNPLTKFHKMSEFGPPRNAVHLNGEVFCKDLSPLLDGVPDGVYEVRIFSTRQKDIIIMKVSTHHDHPVWISKPFALV